MNLVPQTAAELAAERIVRSPAGVARAAARAQALVGNLNCNVLSVASPEERAAAERYHRLRQPERFCFVQPIVLTREHARNGNF